MAIARDTTGTSLGNTTGTSHTASFTNTAGDLLIVHVLITSTSDLVTGVTYNGTAMTQLGKRNGTNSYSSYVYWLSSPATGAHNVVASTSSSTFIGVIAASYSGTSTSGQPDASGTGETPNAAHGSVSVTTIADNCWAAIGISTTNAQNSATLDSGTVLNGGLGPFNVSGIYDTNGVVTPAGSVSLGLTMVSNDDITMVMGSFKPPGGGGGGTAIPIFHRAARSFRRSF